MSEAGIPLRAFACNLFYKLAGLVILVLNKIRHTVTGYTTPRPFPVSDTERAVRYDFSVVEGWLGHLDQYLGVRDHLTGKSVLELGPGAELGVGIIMLAMGAKRYSSLDKFNLAGRAPAGFYDYLFGRIEALEDRRADTASLRDQLGFTQRGINDRLNYIVSDDFDLCVLEGEGIDLVVSHAAFEHFDDFEAVARKLCGVVKSGAVMVAVVDLQTHTRWIRDRDPLNIYRYPDLLYRLLSFPGSPNRLRPHYYREALEKNGWKDIRITPLSMLDEDRFSLVRGGLLGRFRGEKNRMRYLEVALCATKK